MRVRHLLAASAFLALATGCGDSEPLLDAGLDGPLTDVLPLDLLVPTDQPLPDAIPAAQCPDWKCTGTDCTTLIQMPGPYAPATAAEAKQFGYVMVSGQKYSWVRKDLSLVLAWAVCEVRQKFPATTPLGFSDMSQQDGKTPGTDVGQPRHPTTTHVVGRDIDVAYFQTDGENNPQIICGDGSDNNPNGYVGKYNDGYFCTTTENIVDWGPQVWFFAKLFSTGKARVFGIDQMLVDDFGRSLLELKQKGDISEELYQEFNKRVAWGAQGGWQFHHHHVHMSFN